MTGSSLPERGALGPAFGLVLAIAATNFFWQLGSSSYFIDEVYSIRESVGPLSAVLSHVRLYEFNPWTYFVFLHEWIGRTGTQQEWVLRLPSALAGVALVAAVYWMARAFVERRGALLAAALCALSPLVLEYAQQARAYAFAMLAVTLAVGATVRGAREDRRGLLAGGAVTAIASIWLHYSSALVVVPLCLWLCGRNGLPARVRAAFVACCAVGALLLAPLFLDQLHYEPSGGIGPAAGVNWGSMLELGETPFDTRAQTEFDPRALGVGALDALGVAVLLGSVAVLASSGGVRDRRLLLALAVCGPALLVVGGLDGMHVVNKRYAAVAAPFLLTVVAAASGRRGPLGVGLGSAAVVVCVVGSLQTHRPAGFYLPAHEAIAVVARAERAGDVVFAPSDASTFVPLSYYARRLVTPPPPVLSVADSGALLDEIRHRRRLWFISQLPSQDISRAQILTYGRTVLARYGYRPMAEQTVRSVVAFAVVLAAPDHH